MPTYTNIELMLRDIEGYLRVTGGELLVADEPMRGMIGFTTTEEGGPRWEVSLITVIGRYVDPELQRRFVGGAEDRVRLAQELMRSARVGGRVGVADEETVRGLVDRWHQRVDRGNRERHGVPVTRGPRGVEERGTQQAGGSEGGTPSQEVPGRGVPGGRRSGGTWTAALHAISLAAEALEVLDRQEGPWAAAPLVARSSDLCFCALCGEYIRVGESYRDGGTELGRAHVHCAVEAGPDPGIAQTLFDQLAAGGLKIDETK